MAYIDNPNGFRHVRQLDGGVNVGSYSSRLNQSQAVTWGDALIISSGYIQIAVYTSTLILGVATEDLTNASGAYEWLNFEPALAGTVFEGQCSGTPTQASLWTSSTSCLDIEGTTGIMEIDEDASSYDVVMPIGLLDRAAGFGANARLEFVFMLRQLG